MPRIRVNSFNDDELSLFRRAQTTVDHVPVEKFGLVEGVADAVIPCLVRQLNAHERASLDRERHDATLKADLDIWWNVNEGDRATWDRDPGWEYEIVGVDRAHDVVEVLLRRVRA